MSTLNLHPDLFLKAIEESLPSPFLSRVRSAPKLPAPVRELDATEAWRLRYYCHLDGVVRSALPYLEKL